MIEVPASFVFDFEGKVAATLSNPETIAEQLANFEQRVCGTRGPAFLTGCAELVIASPYAGDNYLRHLAYYQAGATVLIGFHESDLPDDFTQRVISQLSLFPVPEGLRQTTYDDRLHAMRDIALKAILQHPELEDVTESIHEYHVETYRASGVGECSIAGAGFIVDRLDKAWNSVQEQLFSYQLADIEPEDFAD